MRKIILYTYMFFISSVLSAQTEFDFYIEKSIYPKELKSKNLLNQDLKKGVTIIDEKLDSIVRVKTPGFKPAKYTIIGKSNIEVYTVMDTLTFVEITKSRNSPACGYDFINSKSFKEVWDESNGDVKIYVDNVSKLQTSFLDSFYPKIKIDHNKILVSSQSYTAKELRNGIKLTRIAYDSPEIQLKLKEEYLKINDTKKRNKFLNYLDKSIHNIDVNSFKTTPQAIRILYFYKLKSKLYFGIDIYGSHYLITLNKKKRKVIDLKRKWFY